MKIEHYDAQKKRSSSFVIRDVKLQEWKPESGTYEVTIDLREPVRVTSEWYPRYGLRHYVYFQIRVQDKDGEKRHLWKIPIAGYCVCSDNNVTVYVFEKSQRGSALKWIVDKYGYGVHRIIVNVFKDKKRPINTKYEIRYVDKGMYSNNSKSSNIERADFINRIKKNIKSKGVRNEDVE